MKTTSPLFTIKQVSAQCGVSGSTLRFWEKKFPGLLAPVRSHGGQRRYSAQHLAIIRRIKQLKDEGMSLDSIQDTIRLEAIIGPGLDSAAKVEVIAERVAGLVKTEVRRVLTEALGS
jgi:DNA-binding transcriptional MerR regulator